MKRSAILIGVALTGLGALPAIAQRPSSPNPAAASPQRLLLNRYCVVCHNEISKTAGLMLDKADVENVTAGAEVWEKVIGKLRTRAMPPAGMPRPDNADYDSFATYLETRLDRAAAAKPNPGRVSSVHRLNRTEYTNAIRDLLALEVDGASLLPADNSDFGFDNNAEMLSATPVLLESYLMAARQISRLAVGDPTIRPAASTYLTPTWALQDQRASEDLPFGSRGGIAIRHTFPLDGEYVFKIRLQKSAGIAGPRMMGLADPHQLDVRLDGERIKLFTVGGDGLAPDKAEARLELRLPVKAGTRVVGVTFEDEDLAPEGMPLPPLVRMQLYGWGARHDSKRDPGVEGVSITGPFAAKSAEETPSRRRIFVCHPDGAQEEDVCARQILSKLARRAYRRPLTEADVQGLLGFYKAGRDSHQNGDGFEAGIQMAVQEILSNPEFLFRFEKDPLNASQAVAYRISDLELASRLSFFLWSSIPDDELLDLAARGKLRDPNVLEQQVRRMLADSRSKSLVDNFFGQWLGVRKLDSEFPDIVAFPDFDENLRDAFHQEMDLFLASMVHEDHSVLDLLNANYTFVNERLARHYGIPDIYGSRFRRVTLTDENRWGLLGKGAILTVTSLPNRTSPVLRGKWVLENILGTPPTPPPPNVPALTENKNTDTEHLTVRQKMEEHRANPVCASCHSRMDPLGFAFDNFDPIGKWRATETIPAFGIPELPVVRNPIDASGVLPDNTKFSGPAELRKILLKSPGSFVGVATEKLLTYALGRGVEYYDQPAVRKIMRDSAPSNYDWSAVILGVVRSAPFQMRTPAKPKTASADSKTVAALR